jgi:catechol 2,3-dioxygenase-like lactoylglutathione lyase family enzyme
VLSRDEYNGGTEDKIKRSKEGKMAVKISHIIIPVKNAEEMKKAGEFFINVIGLHLRDGMDIEGPSLGVDNWTDRGMRLPDRAIHLLDDFGTFVDIVSYNRPISYAKGIGSGKGFALAFQMPDIKKTWASLKNYPTQPIYTIGPYGDDPDKPGDPIMPHSKEPWLGKYFAFFTVDIGRVSEDGEEQIIEICEMKEK